MIPIYEQGTGRGIGHSLQSFLERFDGICASHLVTGRARAFGFILYDFHDADLRKLLKDQGVFAHLDRLTNNQLSLFYLHSGRNSSIRAFNSFVARTLSIREDLQLPCVLFFRSDVGEIRDVVAVQLDQADLIHGLQELYAVLTSYLAQTELPPVHHSRLVESVAKLVSLAALKQALRHALRRSHL